MEATDPKILLDEIDNQIRRLKDQAVVDYKKELLANCYPLMRMLAESVIVQGERLDLAEGAIAEALMHMESQILPDLAASIQMTLALGLRVGELIAESEVWKDHPMPDDLRATIDAFAKAAKQLSDDVSAVTLEAVDDDDLEEPKTTDDEDVAEKALTGEENSK